MEKINLQKKFSLIENYWDPKIAGEVNDTYIKLAKFKGEFEWHKHDDEDECFFVIKGKLQIKLRDRDIYLDSGEFIVIPKGVEHLPVADEEVQVVLIEPKTVLNTGDKISNLTKSNLERI